MAAALAETTGNPNALQVVTELSAMMPKTVEEAVNVGVPMKVMNQVAPVMPFLEFQVLALAARINVDQRLTIQEHQLTDIADAILDMFPYESIEDISLALKRGSQGRYGEVYRLDAAVICRWIQKYLEEKYAVVERLNNQTKKSPYQARVEYAQGLIDVYEAIVGNDRFKPEDSTRKETEYQLWRKKWMDSKADEKQNHDNRETITPEPSRTESREDGASSTPFGS